MTLWNDLIGSELRWTGTDRRTRMLRRGTGEPVLLLHGQGGHLENFSRNIRRLAQRHQVHAIDFSGHGLSGPLPDDLELIEALVIQVLDVLDHEGIERCHIEGQSMGGWVATRLALRAPERVQSLVLSTPMGVGEDAVEDWSYRRRLAAVHATQLDTLKSLSHETVRARMATLFADPTALDEELVETRLAIYTQPGRRESLHLVADQYFPSLLDATHHAPVRIDELYSVEVPVLVLWGDNNISPREIGEAIASRVPDGSFVCLAGGHWAHYESAVAHDELVADFLERIRAGGRARHAPDS